MKQTTALLSKTRKPLNVIHGNVRFTKFNKDRGNPIGSADIELLRKLNVLFGEAFADADIYAAQPPHDAYIKGLLAKEHIIVLVAIKGEEVVGGLVAYELDKFERMRREFYIYDLAVAAKYRRRGIATALVIRLREIAVVRGVWVIYVQADYPDVAAIALYEKLGTREEVLHFDIGVE